MTGILFRTRGRHRDRTQIFGLQEHEDGDQLKSAHIEATAVLLGLAMCLLKRWNLVKDRGAYRSVQCESARGEILWEGKWGIDPWNTF